MRAMILAAGLGERMRPLSLQLPKPVLPIRGVPLIAYTLELLAHHGVREVVMNVHHLADELEQTVNAFCPEGLSLEFSSEPELLGTGGGIRRVAEFLRESDPCLVLAGDMILDADLSKLIDLHRTRGNCLTFLLKDDERKSRFGTIGIDSRGRVRRVANMIDLGGEVESGLYAHATVISAQALNRLLELTPADTPFSHLEGWVVPLLAEGAENIGAVVWNDGACVWEPVGTPGEYLHANLRPPRLSYLDPDVRARARGVRLDDEHRVVLGRNANLGNGSELERAVVWDDERVPDGFHASDGVFAGGEFHACPHWSDAHA